MPSKSFKLFEDRRKILSGQTDLLQTVYQQRIPINQQTTQTVQTTKSTNGVSKPKSFKPKIDLEALLKKVEEEKKSKLVEPAIEPTENLIKKKIKRKRRISLEACRDIKDAEKLIQEKMELHELTKNGWTYKISSKMVTCAGKCSYKKNTLTFAKNFCTNVEESELINTILHEIAHAIVGPKTNHNETWRKLHIKMGGDGERCHRETFSPPKYLMECTKCQKIWKRYRKPFDGNYSCSCGGKVNYTKVKNED